MGNKKRPHIDKAILSKKNNNWGTITDILQSNSDKNNMVLEQKQTYDQRNKRRKPNMTSHNFINLIFEKDTNKHIPENRHILQ